MIDEKITINKYEKNISDFTILSENLEKLGLTSENGGLERGVAPDIAGKIVPGEVVADPAEYFGHMAGKV